MDESMKRNERRATKKIVSEMFCFEESVIDQSMGCSLSEENLSEEVFTNENGEYEFSETDPSEDKYIDSDSESDCDGIGDINEDLAIWVNRYRPSREAVNELLKILSKQGLSVPKDSRTLLKSPRVVDVVSKCGGTFSYLGIKTGILIALENMQAVENEIFLDVDIDGVPLTKSSNSQLWPILGAINNSDFVFVIAVFHSFSKPSSVDDYLSDFIKEARQLLKDGICYNDTHFKFSIRSFICDSPARSFLKCTIGHTGYHSCERCCIRGERVQNRIVFNDVTFKEIDRNGTDFKLGSYMDNHQKNISSLVHLGIDCVNQFPLDYMHLVLLGVVKRILSFLTKGPAICKLSHQMIQFISERMQIHSGLMPSEFNRQPRSLSELPHWKSTEFRQFLLFHGPIVLKGIVDKKLYEHFLSLHAAITILLRSEIQKDHLSFATTLLQWFVKNVVHHYGPTFNVYNIHGLSHITDDVSYFSSDLNKISAFKFENFMQKIKKSVRSSKSPVVQVVKRMEEMNSCINHKAKSIKLKVTGKD